MLMEHREEDVSKTMYKETIVGGSIKDDADDILQQACNASACKVNRICDAFLNVLVDRTSTHFQNVISAHVCKTPPDLDAGLSQIAGLRSVYILANKMLYCN